MKVVAINGSARKQGNTVILIKHVLSELDKVGIETELIELAGKKIQGCTACYKCFDKKDGHCAVKGDIVNDCIDKMRKADGIILGSPIYFADITAEMKALIERSGMTALANGSMFKRKVGAAVIAVRRGGAIHGFDSINHFFHINQMIVPGASYWNMGLGREVGDVKTDEEGIRIMKNLGENIAWLMKMIFVDE